MYIPIGFDSNLQLEYGESMKITEDNWLEILRDKYGGWGENKVSFPPKAAWLNQS